MADRTTKFLLTMIMVALWGILLRPLFSETPVRAQDQQAPANSSTSLTVYDNARQDRICVVSGGKIYLFDMERNKLNLEDAKPLR